MSLNMNFGMRGHDIPGDTFEEICKNAESGGINIFQLALFKSVKNFWFFVNSWGK